MISPSTWGCKAEALRDLRVARESVDKGTSCACAVITSTGNAGGPPAAAASVVCLLQPANSKARAQQSRLRVGIKGLLSNLKYYWTLKSHDKEQESGRMVFTFFYNS